MTENDLRNWNYQILDASQLPDVEAIYAQKKKEAFEQKGKRRWMAAGVGVIVGFIVLAVTQNIPAWLVVMMTLSASGFGFTHWFLLAGANRDTDLEVLPTVAGLCNGHFYADCQQILPVDHPLARKVAETNRFNTNSMSLKVGGFSIGGDGLTVGGRDKSWLEHGYGIQGTIPNTSVPYGIANVTFCEEVKDSDGDKTTRRSEYVLGWIGVQLPMPSLEVKRRRFMKANMFTRAFDKLDSKFTDQNVLDMESETFNQAFKVEVHDHSDDITVRRMFSPKIMDAFVHGQIQMPDDLIYRNGAVFIVDGTIPQFNARTATATVDNMIYRSKIMAQLCSNLAKHAGA